MSDNTNPSDSLWEAERIRQTVDERTARWYSRYFTLMGFAMLAVFGIYALPSPWVWVAYAVAMASGLVLLWFYERTQPTRRQSSQRRFWGAFGTYVALVVVLTTVGALLFDAPPTWWYLTTAVVVAMPFFLAARLERRPVTPVPDTP